MAEPRASVFISYDQADRDQAVELVRRLQDVGFQTWIDAQDLAEGNSWAADPGKAIAQANAAVVLVGRSGAGRRPEFSRLEKRARDRAFLLIPGTLAPADFRSWPKFLASRQAVDLEAPGGFELLVTALAGEPVQSPPGLSPSVSEARLQVLAGEGPIVSSLELAAAIAGVHPEYGGGLAGRLPSLRLPGVDRRHVDDWLREVRGLVSETAVPELHGRVVMLGLGLLDPALRGAYRRADVEQALVDELDEPIDKLLTERGRALWEEREEPQEEPASPEESVPTHGDNPATVDELDREGIARVLAARIRDMRTQERAAFLVHLHAPWGMGKTSLLNFLRKELGPESTAPWIVIEFNAWRHQRIAPPWWWLMTALYQQGRKELQEIDPARARKLRFHEWRWRGLVGWLLLLLAVLAGGVLVWQTGWVGDLWRSDEPLKALGAFVLAATPIVVALATLWGTARSVGNWFLTASPRSARAYVHHSRDPMETVQEHFADLVRWLHYPVIILIDDLDRCRGDYVVELLEGIQTLFRDQPVAYVVAADRDWLSDSYQVAYGDFVSANDEPGRPLGYLFLEKTFQMSVTLPPPSATIHAGYWGLLLRPGGTVDFAELEEARVAADAVFAKLGSEAAVHAELDRAPGATPAEQRARREAAAIQLASPMLAQETQHALEPFAGLLDSNPRALKRLVNAYGIARGIEALSTETLEGGRAAQQTTALWTILALRWPRLADYLAVHPEHVALVRPGAEPPEEAADEIGPLFGNPKVFAVVSGQGDGIDVALDEATIRRCAGQVQV